MSFEGGNSSREKSPEAKEHTLFNDALTELVVNGEGSAWSQAVGSIKRFAYKGIHGTGGREEKEKQLHDVVSYIDELLRSLTEQINDKSTNESWVGDDDLIQRINYRRDILAETLGEIAESALYSNGLARKHDNADPSNTLRSTLKIYERMREEERQNQNSGFPEKVSMFLYKYGSPEISAQEGKELRENMHSLFGANECTAASFAVMACLDPDSERMIRINDADGTIARAQARCLDFFKDDLAPTGQDTHTMLSHWIKNSSARFNVDGDKFLIRLSHTALMAEPGDLPAMDKMMSAINAAIQGNIRSVRDLERLNPGVTRKLLDQYGILEYHRYPTSVLIDQINEENGAKPYGVLMATRSDYNGAFSASTYRKALDSFSKQLKEVGHMLRIVEAPSKRSLARRLISLDRHFASTAGQITFALIAGHGHKDSITFGDSSDLADKIRSEDLSGWGFNRSGEFFKEKAPIVLISCSTGVEAGLGQQLSRAFGTKVIAPDRPTNLVSITPILTADGRIDLSATFTDEDTSRSYVGGQEEV